MLVAVHEFVLELYRPPYSTVHHLGLGSPPQTIISSHPRLRFDLLGVQARWSCWVVSGVVLGMSLRPCLRPIGLAHPIRIRCVPVQTRRCDVHGSCALGVCVAVQLSVLRLCCSLGIKKKWMVSPDRPDHHFAAGPDCGVGAPGHRRVAMLVVCPGCRRSRIVSPRSQTSSASTPQ